MFEKYFPADKKFLETVKKSGKEISGKLFEKFSRLG